jgi:23S rRNA (guanosine2251-2'-O)-methyltransferase
MARRRRSDHDFLYGMNPANEALRGRRQLHRLWVRESGKPSGRLADVMELARTKGVEIREADTRLLDELSQNGNHQGVVLEAGPFPYVELDELLENANGRAVLVLDRLQDPQNLATLIRTAVAVDVAGLVIQTERSSSITPAVVRSSAGLAEHACVARVTNTRSAVDRIKDAGYWAVALEAGEGSVDIYQADIPQPTALIVGAEASGVSRPVLKTCDLVVRLPMPGPVESLNAAVAGSVALFELFRRNQLAEG